MVDGIGAEDGPSELRSFESNSVKMMHGTAKQEQLAPRRWQLRGRSTRKETHSVADAAPPAFLPTFCVLTSCCTTLHCPSLDLLQPSVLDPPVASAVQMGRAVFVTGL